MRSIFKNAVTGVGLVVLFAYTTNAQWVQIYKQKGQGILSLAVSGCTILAGTYSDGAYFSNDSGKSWVDLFYPPGPSNPANPRHNDVTALRVVSDNTILAGSGSSGVFRSTNNGTSWSVVIENGPGNIAVTSLVVIGNNIFVGYNGGGIIRSTNNGTSWTKVDSGLTSTNVQSLAITSSGEIYAGTFGGGVYRSTNNGTSWNEVNNGLLNKSVLSLTVYGINIFAGTDGGGVFLSINNGTSWAKVDSGLINLYIRSLVVSGSNIFAGTYGGVYQSANNGKNWSAVNSGFTDTNVHSLAVSDKYIYAGLSENDSNGVWRRPLSEMQGVINPIPRKGISTSNLSGFKINANKNAIFVSLPSTLAYGKVRIVLYAISGKSIYCGTQNAYNAILRIPASGLSTGTYLISITGRSIALSSSFLLTR